MKPIHVSEKAEADLEEHWMHIAQDNAPAADRRLAAVEVAFDSVRRQPGIGWQKPFRNRRLRGLRLWPVPGFHNYLIFYRETEETVEILPVLHGARDYERIMAT
jgi:plasmid stabilization system protein ParE